MKITDPRPRPREAARRLNKRDHLEEPFPHEPGCPRCREHEICNVCGGPTGIVHGRCTNGRCRACHGRVCTSGGSTSPGHGYGSTEPEGEHSYSCPCGKRFPASAGPLSPCCGKDMR